MAKMKFYYWLLLPVLALLMGACEESDDDDEYGGYDSGDLTETVSQKPDIDLRLGQPFESIVNENNCVVEGNGYTIELSPSIVENDTKLTVTPARPPGCSAKRTM